MKKMLKENKGFSLVELLVALLIMAVIAATAITLFGGVLDTSKGRADAETAENIKRAILTYMNASGDNDLSAIGVVSGTTTSKQLCDALSCQFEITETAGTNFPGTKPTGSYTNFELPNDVPSTSVDSTDMAGTYGPFLDVTKDCRPTQSGKDGWVITIDSVMQAITVKSGAEDSSTPGADCVVTINLSGESS